MMSVWARPRFLQFVESLKRLAEIMNYLSEHPNHKIYDYYKIYIFKSPNHKFDKGIVKFAFSPEKYRLNKKCPK